MASSGANSCYKLLISSLLLHLVGFPWPGSQTYLEEHFIKTAEAARETSDSAGYSAYVTFRVKPRRNDTIRGAFGRVTIWNPNVTRPEDYSLGKFSIVRVNQTQNITASMEAGYIVFPARYGDNTTRFYIRWEKVAANGTRIGCFDLDCKGFIPSQSGGQYIGTRLGTSQTAPGGIEPIGRGITLQIQQLSNGNWILRRDGLVIGNWPSSLFEGSGQFNAVDFGGEVYDSTGNSSPTSQMGNGVYPTGANNAGAYIYDVSVSTTRRNGVLFGSTLFSQTNLRVSNPSCYTANIIGRNSRITSEGAFFYGGPGCRQQ